jgi:hypothetical protein
MFSNLSVKAPAAAASLDPFGLTPSASSSTSKPMGDPLDFLAASRPAPAAAAAPSSFDFLGGGGGQAAAQPMMRNAYGQPQQPQQMGGYGMGYPSGMQQQQPMGAYGMGMGMAPQQHQQMGYGMQHPQQQPHAFAFGNAAAADPFANIGAKSAVGGAKPVAATTVNSKINDSFSFVNDMLKK